ncbi:hypothetical protein [Paenibacillus peoriae]|uniref:hypothetical protein n=1 Tax=Paenibacillus peoriae TaxID=59893 RepID=UPI0021DF9DD6|nr:hypothetical protein [Paenibacillus peoriae]
MTTVTTSKRIPKSRMKSTGERVYTFITEVKKGKLVKKRFCTKCEQYKDYSQYHKHRALPEGIAACCKSCKTAAAKDSKLEMLADLLPAPRQPIAPAAEKKGKVEKMTISKKDKVQTTAVSENFALLTNRLSVVEEVRQLRMKETTLVSIISALAKRNGGKLEVTKEELEAVGECVFDMEDTVCTIRSGKALTI